MMSQPKQKRVDNIRQKRIQIDDDDGWTHITTSGGSKNNNNSSKKSSNKSKPGKNRPKDKPPSFNDQLRPAEAPRNLTFRGLEEQFQVHRRKWEESQCYDTVRWGVERATVLRRGGGPPGGGGGTKRRIEKCVCIGLGSPSGFLRGGLVDRRAISLYQLAGLVSLLEWISSSPRLKKTLDIKQIYAQDPVFNQIDKQLLSFLNIQVVDDPVAFNLVDEDTFLYCPGAERSHLVDLLRKDPVLFFGGPLKDGHQSLLNKEEEYTLSEFSRTRESVKLPPFEPDERAFWNMSLFWKSDHDDNDDD